MAYTTNRKKARATKETIDDVIETLAIVTKEIKVMAMALIKMKASDSKVIEEMRKKLDSLVTIQKQCDTLLKSETDITFKTSQLRKMKLEEEILKKAKKDGQQIVVNIGKD